MHSHTIFPVIFLYEEYFNRFHRWKEIIWYAWICLLQIILLKFQLFWNLHQPLYQLRIECIIVVLLSSAIENMIFANFVAISHLGIIQYTIVEWRYTYIFQIFTCEKKLRYRYRLQSIKFEIIYTLREKRWYNRFIERLMFKSFYLFFFLLHPINLFIVMNQIKQKKWIFTELYAW